MTFLEQLLREFSVGDRVLQICSENCFIFKKHFQVKAVEEDASHMLPVLLSPSGRSRSWGHGFGWILGHGLVKDSLYPP